MRDAFTPEKLRARASGVTLLSGESVDRLLKTGLKRLPASTQINTTDRSNGRSTLRCSPCAFSWLLPFDPNGAEIEEAFRRNAEIDAERITVETNGSQ
jgi:hypothetical protein